MDGRRFGFTFFSSLAMTLLFVSIMLSPLTITSADVSPSTVNLIDGRISGFQAEPSENYTREWMMEEGEWLSLTLDCSQCEAQLTLDGSTSTTSTEITLQAVNNGSAHLSIVSSIQE
ncbi:MAG TPA: hypothetical protein QF401_05795, partial [Candidatus Poseidoniaceae archaeon]|nr:hypothetical protein [Candidatus Poseidoniaceae archaeon]